MKPAWWQLTLLRAAAAMTPGEQRGEWLAEWQAELWYVPRGERPRFCLGAFRDALWMWRNNANPRNFLESPLRCLCLLAVLASVSCRVALYLPGPHKGPWPEHLKVRDLPAGCMAMLLLTCLLFPATWMAMEHGPANGHVRPWRSRLARGIFLALKIALVQPILLSGFMLLILGGHLVPFVPSLAMVALWILAFRWVLLDQRRRCPVCLRLLTKPVGFGNSSHTFLDWYGVESMCSRGHGLLQSPEIPNGSCGEPQWLRLDGSWRELFSDAAGARPR